MGVADLYMAFEGAETQLIKSILERHSINYLVHDVTNVDVAANLRKRMGSPADALIPTPMLLVGKVALHEQPRLALLCQLRLR